MAASIAVELIVQTSPPKRGMSGATVRTFGFNTARSRVPKGISSAMQQGRVQTRRSGTRPRRTDDEWLLEIGIRVHRVANRRSSGCAG